MSLRARLAALLFAASTLKPRDRRLLQLTTEVHGPVLTPAREAELREAGRAAVATLCIGIERLS